LTKKIIKNIKIIMQGEIKMIKIPEKINLANLPTKIEKLDRLSKQLGGPNIYMKRDDQTGTELSGNKVRKLEYSIKEAMDKGCDYLITCGGIQSNHARATAAAATKMGMKSCLLLRGSMDNENEIDGNLFINKLLGAEVRFVTKEDYSNRRLEIMKEISAEKELQGYKPYIIPEGASNGIGTFGYYGAMEEIITQEKEMGIKFDAIFIATGSGGTYSGLFLANKLHGDHSVIFGVNVCDDAEHFKNIIEEILYESMAYIDEKVEFTKDEINIVDGYVGRGYALSRPEEISLIKEIAALEGVILDPVYTGKGMYGLTEEIRKGSFKEFKNILFIHTGGLFGLFPQKSLFEF
jgi:D-cysteine desulfhydrase